MSRKTDKAYKECNRPRQRGVCSGSCLESGDRCVEESVRHVETVCFYIDDELFCVKERCTNLIRHGDETGLINHLHQRPVASWTTAQRLAVIALRSLFCSPTGETPVPRVSSRKRQL